jgi:hypothetical protein
MIYLIDEKTDTMLTQKLFYHNLTNFRLGSYGHFLAFRIDYRGALREYQINDLGLFEKHRARVACP